MTSYLTSLHSLTPPVTRTAVKNRKFRAELTTIIHEAGLEGGCDKARGALLYTTASKVAPLPACPSALHGMHMLVSTNAKRCAQDPGNAPVHRPHFVREYLSTGKVKVGSRLPMHAACVCTV